MAEKRPNGSLSDFIVSRLNTPIVSINNERRCMKNNIRVDVRTNEDNINFHIFLSHRLTLHPSRSPITDKHRWLVYTAVPSLS